MAGLVEKLVDLQTLITRLIDQHLALKAHCESKGPNEETKALHQQILLLKQKNDQISEELEQSRNVLLGEVVPDEKLVSLLANVICVPVEKLPEQLTINFNELKALKMRHKEFEKLYQISLQARNAVDPFKMWFILRDKSNNDSKSNVLVIGDSSDGNTIKALQTTGQLVNEPTELMLNALFEPHRNLFSDIINEGCENYERPNIARIGKRIFPEAAEAITLQETNQSLVQTLTSLKGKGNSCGPTKDNFNKWLTLSRIQEDLQKKEDVSLFTYGPSGAGKTTFATNFIEFLISTYPGLKVQAVMTYVFFSPTSFGFQLLPRLTRNYDLIKIANSENKVDMLGAIKNPFPLNENTNYKFQQSSGYTLGTEKERLNSNEMFQSATTEVLKGIAQVQKYIGHAAYRSTTNNNESSRSVLYFRITLPNDQTVHIIDLFGNEKEEKAPPTTKGFSYERPNLEGESLGINYFLKEIGIALEQKKKGVLIDKKKFELFPHFLGAFEPKRVHLAVLGVSSAPVEYMDKDKKKTVLNDIYNTHLTFKFIQNLNGMSICKDIEKDREELKNKFSLTDESFHSFFERNKEVLRNFVQYEKLSPSKQSPVQDTSTAVALLDNPISEQPENQTNPLNGNQIHAREKFSYLPEKIIYMLGDPIKNSKELNTFFDTNEIIKSLTRVQKDLLNQFLKRLKLTEVKKGGMKTKRVKMPKRKKTIRR